MKDGKYSVMIVEDQQMPKALFSHFVESSDKFYLQVAIENASVADIVCTCTPVDLILMDVVTENGESGLEAAAKIKAKFPKTQISLNYCKNIFPKEFSLYFFSFNGKKACLKFEPDEIFTNDMNKKITAEKSRLEKQENEDNNDE